MINGISSNNFQNVRTSGNVQANNGNCGGGDCFTRADSESVGSGVYGRMSFNKAGERGGDLNPATAPAEFAYYACCDT